MAERDDIAKEERMLQMKRQQRHAGFHGIGGPVEKAKDFKGTLRRLLAYMKRLLAPMILVFIMVIVSGVLESYTPTVLAGIMDIVENGFRAGPGMMDMDSRHSFPWRKSDT